MKMMSPEMATIRTIILQKTYIWWKTFSIDSLQPEIVWKSSFFFFNSYLEKIICPIEAILVICSYFQAESLMNRCSTLFIISVDGIINQRAKIDERFLIPQTSFKLYFHWRRSAPPPSVNITSERSVLTHLTYSLTRVSVLMRRNTNSCKWSEVS